MRDSGKGMRASGMTMRAIIFEDNEAYRTYLSSLLEERGYEVYAFSEAGGCPLYLQERCPCPEGYVCADIIITDLRMPRVTGLKLIEHQLRLGCKGRNIAIISGRWSKADRSYALALGCKVLEKSIDTTELIQWLEECEGKMDMHRRLWDWFKEEAAISPTHRDMIDG
ncbi:MAG: response regulator [Deltaproteobacteria bacterium]|nr:response regulator [Deltaproteobacteria bacterium]